VRREDIKSGEWDLKNNDKVTYEATQATEGPEARNVSRT
jgi:cold shock CspA family protein